MMGSQLEYRLAYRRYLPHIQPPGATFFVTFRLAGSLPKAIIEQLRKDSKQIEQRIAGLPLEERKAAAYREHRRMFGRWDEQLDSAADGPRALAEPAVSECVAQSIHYWDGRRYDLDVFCIMSNHVHLVLTPVEFSDGSYYSLARVLHTLKRHTARQSNLILGRRGRFWQPESYDHVVRDADELGRIRRYVINNPVKAGLVNAWHEWPWTYCSWLSDSLSVASDEESGPSG
jgi:REP element-mobilizing transposase RayT